ncbi:MAG: hypothetical protein J6Q68_05325, partial [Clostridia bacterium]|nr:hypothetical protein [Clostridia bacterium]
MTLNVCSVIALVYMAITVIISAVSLKVADRKNRLNLIQNYKKGRFLIFYFSALPIYFAAYSHIGDSVVRAALKAIKFTVATAVLSFDQDVLIPIMSENTLFAVTTVIFISLAVLNTVLFSVSVFYRMLVNEAILKKIKKGKKDAVVIVGCGKKSQMIIDSMKRAGGEKSATSHKACDLLVLADNLTDEFKEYAYINRAAYIKFGDGDNLEETLKKNCASYGTRHVSVIIMTENETADLKLAFQAAALTSGIGTELNTAYTDTVCGIDVYVFSNEDNEAVYRRIIQASHGMVHCLNKYKMISVDFINNHPATLFIPNLINTKKATLKEGTDLRIQMIGFGKVNRQ